MIGPRHPIHSASEDAPEDEPHLDDCPASEDPDKDCRCKQLIRDLEADHADEQNKSDKENL